MSIPIEDARAQLNQKLHCEGKDSSSLAKDIGSVDPTVMLILACAVGEAMNRETARNELPGLITGVQGMLFSGDWDHPSNEYEDQIALLMQNIGGRVVNEKSAKDQLSLLDEVVTCVMLYQILDLDTNTRMSIAGNLKHANKRVKSEFIQNSIDAINPVFETLFV